VGPQKPLLLVDPLQQLLSHAAWSVRWTLSWAAVLSWAAEALHLVFQKCCSPHAVLGHLSLVAKPVTLTLLLLCCWST